ncbi:MAG TPA: enoyl-CoA hydratase [Dehalococcoidia bacterium]|nr:enoyl-CoA hydratase [Chloroflexota bacterium]HCL26675.1 enoyl-CoA hydratase [Dehalococcoidia bacterium]
MAETILYEKQGNIVVMTLNRPDSLNAINRQLRQELSDAIVEFDNDPEAFVAVVTGAGRAFCSGRDLKERAEDNAQGIQAKASASMRKDTPYMWPQTWKPMIAAVNGFALAGGWSIAQLCDLRIASEDAKLGISETKWSLLPPFGTVLTKQMQLSAVLELVLTAQPVTAQRAYDMGFLNKVVPAADLMEEAMAMAQSIADNAPLAVQTFKELAYRGLNMSNQDISALTYQMYDALLLTEDSREGPKAFAEKRKPQWKGR